MSSLRWVWSNLILFTFRYLVLYQLIQNAQPAVSREMRERGKGQFYWLYRFPFIFFLFRVVLSVCTDLDSWKSFTCR